jgi:hypothetical protein
MAIPVREEQEWAQRYPVPNADELQDLRLTLWNYPVAKTDLAPEPGGGGRKFLTGDFLELQLSRRTETQLLVYGHASDSGEASANDQYSHDRAQKVARFLISEGFPASQIRVEGHGSSEPEDSGASGYAAARNRRVEVRRFVPSKPEKPQPSILPEPPEQERDFRIPKSAQPSSVTIDIPLDIPLPPIKTPGIIIGGKIGGVLKLKVDDKGGGWGGGAAISNGKLTAKFESKITDDLKAKINFEPKSGGKEAVLKVGGEVKIGQLDTTVGMQTKLPNFVYCEFSFEAFRLPDIELGDVHVTMTLKPTLKIDAGPGPALLARVGVSAGTAGAIAAGTVLFSALIIVACAKTVEYAKDEGVRTARLLARREGVAARIAWEVAAAANAGAGDVEFRDRRAEWARSLDGMGPAFDAGAELVNALLRKGPRDQMVADWTAKYGSTSKQFGDVQKAVLDAIKPYEDGPEDEDPTTRL